MMLFQRGCIIVFVILFYSCSGNGPDVVNKNGVNPAGLFAGFQSDSFELVLPGNVAGDKQVATTVIKDPYILQFLDSNLRAPAFSRKECPHDSRLYLFRRGEVYKTVYISDSCGYFAYALNSTPYYVTIRPDLKAAFDSIRNTIFSTSR